MTHSSLTPPLCIEVHVPNLECEPSCIMRVTIIDLASASKIFDWLFWPCVFFVFHFIPIFSCTRRTDCWKYSFHAKWKVAIILHWPSSGTNTNFEPELSYKIHCQKTIWKVYPTYNACKRQIVILNAH